MFEPRLKGRPVVVLSNNDGCCVARSNEVKALGVKMTTPWFQLRELAERHGIIAFSSNYSLYADLSARFMRVLSQFSPGQEIYSIDECFLDLTGLERHERTDYGRQIRGRVQQWLGLPVCVGIAPTKTLAKLANHIAKHRSAGDGVFDYAGLTADEQNVWLDGIEVGEVWGVGRRLSERLNQRGILTVRHLRDANANAIRREFGVVLERTVRELRGVSCLPLESVTPAKQEILCSRSFGQRLRRLEPLQAAVASYTARAAEKLRQQGSVAAHLQVFLQTNAHRSDEPQYHPAILIPLVEATADTAELIRQACAGLKQIYRPGYRYQKAGVMLMDLRPAATSQPDLFSATAPAQRAQREQLMRTLDRINQRLGRGTVRFGREGFDPSWKLRADYPSSKYTTRWEELPVAYAR